MRYLRLISCWRSPVGCSGTFKNLQYVRSLPSKTVYFSTNSFSDVFRKRNLIIPNETICNRLSFARESTTAGQETKLAHSERVSTIVDDISALTLLEVADLTEVLRKRLDINEMPIMTMMMPGMGISVKSGVKGSGGSKTEEKKAEKTTFDLKLEGFDAAAKIKIIKEVRTFTDLGLKEAKDLVEKAPTVLKKGLLKDEAEKIIEKMKEVGAKVVME